MATTETLKQKFLWTLVLRCLPKTRFLLDLRLVCKDWAHIIAEENLLNSFIFTVNGARPASINSFTSLRWKTSSLKHFRFENLDLELRLFGNPNIFQKFTTMYCVTLRSLVLINCVIGTGRLLELLAFCKNIKLLKIHHCPHFYKVNLGIFHWGFCMKSVARNLMSITKLRLHEEEISDHNLWALAGQMKHLQSLHVKVDQVALPVIAICNILCNNAKIIEDLTLGGLMFGGEIESYASLELLPEFELLTRVRFDGGQCWEDSHSYMLKQFFRKCPNLLDLYLSDASLDKNPLFHIDKGLVTLSLVDCFCSVNTESSKFNQLQTLRLGVTRKTYNETKSVKCFHNILKCKKPLLEHLELRSAPNALTCLNLITPSAIPSLKHLFLIDLCDIFGMELKNILRNFPHLESLSLRRCKGLDDETFKGIGMSGGLPQMTNLRMLDISCSAVGNDSTGLIRKLKSLRELYMSDTKLNTFGLVEIAEGIPCKELPDLTLIDVRDSKCHLSLDMMGAIYEMAPNLQILYW